MFWIGRAGTRELAYWIILIQHIFAKHCLKLKINSLQNLSFYICIKIQLARL